MSGTFDPQDEQTLNQALRVQELVVSGLDYQMYSVAPGAPIITLDPFLGVAGSYAIIANTAITNTGSSVITGNVGLTPGSSITPGGWTVSGTINVDNPAAVAALAAANSGYTALNALTPTVIANSLDGQTLTPGVYSFSAGNVSLAGSGNATLTLNGAGTYVFQAPSTITMGAGGIPTILLTGGATAGKVYFTAGTSSTLNVSASGTLNGNFISHTSTTVDGGTVNGSVYGLNGAVTISAASNITAESGSSSSPSINLSIFVREPVAKIFNAFVKVDASNTMVDFDQAEMAIIDDSLLQITSISASNPTIVTTLTPHFLATKEQVMISGTNSTPILDGVQAVTVTGPNTFALPIHVTVSGSAGTVDADMPPNDLGVIELLGLPGTAFNPNDVAAVKYATLPSYFYV